MQDSTSSEEGFSNGMILTSSDEINAEVTEPEPIPVINNSQRISEFVDQQRREVTNKESFQRRDSAQPVAGPSRTSNQHDDRRMVDYFRSHHDDKVTPEERAEKYVREAEKSKARMLQTPGMANPMNAEVDIMRLRLHTAIIDEDYETVASHVDIGLREKIINGEYVDFAKLIAKDRVQLEQDYRLQQFYKDGQLYLAPPPSATAITSFQKWERAFRVFSNIYIKKFPYRAWELNEYNHMIHHISQTYVWENCYSYDIDFRIHMSNHTERSWAMVLQKSWSFRLNEKLQSSDFMSRNSGDRRSFGKSSASSSSDYCRRFNRGKCTYGASCRFEHRCFHCHKFGHGIHNCRKHKVEKDTRNNNNDRTNQQQPNTRGPIEQEQQKSIQ